MTQGEKCIAIAKACGWEWKRSEQTIVPEWHSPSGEVGGFCPNYFNSLDACHEMEKVLSVSGGSAFVYVEELKKFCGGCLPDVVRATAAQRAEAFGKTLNLW